MKPAAPPVFALNPKPYGNNGHVIVSPTMDGRPLGGSEKFDALSSEDRDRCLKVLQSRLGPHGVAPDLLTNELDHISKQAADRHGEERHAPIVVRSFPESLADAAYLGFAGELVRAIEPHTEAHPAALLIQFLVAFGNRINRNPHFTVEGARHGTNLYACLVGDTSAGRKGTSWKRVLSFIEAAEPNDKDSWLARRIITGLSSGEGLIEALRDPADGDAGVEDKRLLVIEGEFASALQRASRDGSTLSATLRSAWDGDNLKVLNRKPMTATKPHVSIIGHITREELSRTLTSTEAANGFANRFLWVATKRTKHLPDGGSPDEETVTTLAMELSRRFAKAENIGEVKRTEDAKQFWYQLYPRLSEPPPGLLGSVLSRACPQFLRLAMLYALVEGRKTIDTCHMQAAQAAWEYCERSAAYVFGDALGDDTADEMIEALRKKPDGMSRSELRDLFNRNSKPGEIKRALTALLQQGRASFTMVETGGKPKEVWKYVERPNTTIRPKPPAPEPGPNESAETLSSSRSLMSYPNNQANGKDRYEDEERAAIQAESRESKRPAARASKK